MVNNSTNINKTKQSLNSQQFHQYQQNEQPTLTITQWTQKGDHDMTLEIQLMAGIGTHMWLG